MMFDIAKNAAKSDACQSLVNIGYKITAFVEFGNSIADVSIYVLITNHDTLLTELIGKSISEISMVYNDGIPKSKSNVNLQTN